MRMSGVTTRSSKMPVGGRKRRSTVSSKKLSRMAVRSSIHSDRARRHGSYKLNSKKSNISKPSHGMCTRTRKVKQDFDSNDMENMPGKKRRGRPKLKETCDGKFRPQNKSKSNVNNNVENVCEKKGLCSPCEEDKQEKKSGKSLHDCYFCKVKSSTLIKCEGCNNKAHTTCTGISDHVWKCHDCETCCICKRTENKKRWIVCCNCKQKYHFDCHVPSVSESNEHPEWSCFHCSLSLQSMSSSCVFQHTQELERQEEDETLTNNLDTKVCKSNKHYSKLYKSNILRHRRRNITTTGNETLSKEKQVEKHKHKAVNTGAVKGKVINIKKVKKDNVGVRKKAIKKVTAVIKKSTVKPGNVQKENMKEKSGNNTCHGIGETKKNHITEKKPKIQAQDNYDAANKMKDKIPDCKCWTEAQVEEYLSGCGYPYEGALFRAQNIDGLALLLMKRSDVFKFKNVLVGRALKIHKLIKILQLRRYDV